MDNFNCMNKESTITHDIFPLCPLPHLKGEVVGFVFLNEVHRSFRNWCMVYGVVVLYVCVDIYVVFWCKERKR